MDRRKIIVLATATVALGLLAGATFLRSRYVSSVMQINTHGLPTLGQGPIEMVMFEDFLCESCRVFSEELLPQIEAQSLETGRARYSLVPVAFLEGSKPIANAAWSVYEHTPERFFPFVQELFVSRASTRRELLSAAERTGGIDLHALKEEMDAETYYTVLDQHLQWARSLMGSHFKVPALYIDGVLTPTHSLRPIAQRIDQIEKKS